MRLIDADALIGNVFKNDISYKAFVSLVKRQPTIDAVPVVRCNDCVNFETGDWCVLTGARAREDGYCAWGERKAEP